MIRIVCRLSLMMLVGLIPCFAQDSTLSVAVEKMADQPLPVNIVSANLRNFQYTSQLDAIISIDNAAQVKSADFLLVIFQGGKVIAGEGWRDVKPGGSIFRDTKLALRPGDHAILIVTSVEANSRTFHFNQKELSDRLHDYIEGRQPTSIPIEISLNDTGVQKLIH